MYTEKPGYCFAFIHDWYSYLCFWSKHLIYARACFRKLSKTGLRCEHNTFPLAGGSLSFDTVIWQGLFIVTHLMIQFNLIFFHNVGKWVELLISMIWSSLVIRKWFLKSISAKNIFIVRQNKCISQVSFTYTSIFSSSETKPMLQYRSSFAGLWMIICGHQGVCIGAESFTLRSRRIDLRTIFDNSSILILTHSYYTSKTFTQVCMGSFFTDLIAKNNETLPR